MGHGHSHGGGGGGHGHSHASSVKEPEEREALANGTKGHEGALDANDVEAGVDITDSETKRKLKQRKHEGKLLKGKFKLL